MCVYVLCTCTGAPSSTEAQMAMGKGLIKEESLIKITPLAGGIYAGMQGNSSLVHAHSKHLQDQNPIWTHPKARTGSLKEDLLKNFDNYQHIVTCSRYQFVTEVLCFTDIER